MKYFSILSIGLLAVICGMIYFPVIVYAESTGSVIDFEKYLKQAEEKKQAEEERKKTQLQDQIAAFKEKQYLIGVDWECKTIDSLAGRIMSTNEWSNIDFLKIDSESYSPILSISTSKNNYELNMLYTNGESEKEILKLYWSQHSLYNSLDNKIEFIKITKLGSTDYESPITCDSEIIKKIDIEKRMTEIKQERKLQQEQAERDEETKRVEKEQAEREEQERLDKLYDRAGIAVLEIQSDTYWNAIIQDGNLSTSSFDGSGNYRFDISCGNTDIISLNLQKQTEYGFIDIQLIQKGKILSQATTTAQYGIASITVECIPEFGGGCLIATATYGSEMASEVQQLRELRDNQLLNTESGTAFMGMFNDFYYSFSPVIADYERENPYFKEAVKLFITPMISTLSIMSYADSESEVLGLGLSIIALNVGMYIGVPAIVVIGIRKRF
jgi:hypothetical protein